MSEAENPLCPYCGQRTKKWKVPPISTWATEFQYVCFNDDCEYFVKGWDWMMSQQQVRASYRCRIDPVSGKAHPLPVWDYNALKDSIMD